jgi:hypothetical protein
VSGLASFLPVPVGGRKLSRQGKTDYVLVPVVTTKFTCQDTLYKRRAKNAANCASAGSPIDSVSVAGFVLVHDNLISVFNLSCKVFLVKM